MILTPFDMDAWVTMMAAWPPRRRFTAPQAGLYHFVTGLEPHHERDCDGRCPIGGAPATQNRRRVP